MKQIGSDALRVIDSRVTSIRGLTWRRCTPYRCVTGTNRWMRLAAAMSFDIEEAI